MSALASGTLERVNQKRLPYITFWFWNFGFHGLIFEKRFACFPNIIITNHNNHHQHFVGSIFCSNYKLCFTNFSVIKFSEICSINFMVASYSSSLPYVVISFIIIIQWINHGVENNTFNCNCLLHGILKWMIVVYTKIDVCALS